MTRVRCNKATVVLLYKIDVVNEMMCCYQCNGAN
jgi:hypothetical protein